jgi:pimeloyl-ACP methyl ester carboxylesterase
VSRVEQRVADNGLATIEYRAVGRGPLVVLLPSIGRGTAEFVNLSRSFAARGFRFLLPEPRGFGASRGPIDGITLHDLAEDTAAVIRAEGGGPAIVLGHAFGNWVARLLATTNPDLVLGVGLIAAAAKNWPKSLIADIEISSDTSQADEVRLAALRAAFFAPGNDPHPWLAGWNHAVNISQRDAAACVPAETWYAAGTVPLLDLQGDCDPFRPLSSRYELRDALGSRVVVKVIGQASHALPVEKPSEMLDAVIGWAKTL